MNNDPLDIDLAISLHQSGDLAGAEAAYRGVLAREPGNGDAVHLLGVVRLQRGDCFGAIELIRRAILLKPGTAEYYANLGLALVRAGKVDEGVGCLSEALRLKPGYVEAMINLAVALRLKGRLDEAIALLRQAISIGGENAEALGELGRVLNLQKRFGEAAEAFGRAISVRPSSAATYNELGSALLADGKVAEAIAAHRRAVELSPGRAEFHCGLGIALRAGGLLEEAVSMLETAVKIDPKMAAGANNLGVALRDAGRVDESIRVLRGLVAREPGHAEGHWNLALSLLLAGDYANGWREYEWRRDKSGRHWSEVYSVPAWDGSALNGRRLLVHCEQGFGDIIQFARFLPQLKAAGGEIIFAVPAELERLSRSSIDFARVIRAGEAAEDVHVHCSLQSLPFLLGCEIKSEAPYLKLDQSACDRWRGKLSGSRKSLNVGLAWVGNRRPDPLRSVRGELLMPLVRAQGVVFHSLQKGGEDREIRRLMDDGDVIDHSAELTDFAETGALISNLDLMISIDTSVAHLAGALGKPVWVMLPFSADWRWLVGREDSPWYGSARLFRQGKYGDWRAVIERVSRELDGFRTRSVAS
jgi:Flp pilus assembly protein TadD